MAESSRGVGEAEKRGEIGLEVVEAHVIRVHAERVYTKRGREIGIERRGRRKRSAEQGQPSEREEDGGTRGGGSCVRSIGRVYQTTSVVTAIVPTTSLPDRHPCSVISVPLSLSRSPLRFRSPFSTSLVHLRPFVADTSPLAIHLLTLFPTIPPSLAFSSRRFLPPIISFFPSLPHSLPRHAVFSPTPPTRVTDPPPRLVRRRRVFS